MSKRVNTIREPSDSEQKPWDMLVSHPLQSWEWGQFRAAMNVDVARLGAYEGNTLQDAWQLTFHKIPYTPWTIGYFPKGPMPSKKMIDALMTLGKKKKAIYIQLEPNITQELRIKKYELGILRPSHHPLFTKYTFVVDLTKSEEQLLKDMHPKTRYNIRVAQKHNVTIQEDNSEAAFQTYLDLTAQTTQRQGFFAHNTQYHKTMWHFMSRAGIAHLFTATYQDKPLAAWILFAWKKTLYYPYGASSRDNREVMAPTLLLWEIIKWAKQKGYTAFDLWGAMGPNPDTNDPWYGFHRFKEGFHPTLVEFAGSYDLIINKPLYNLYTIADTVRWKLLKILK